MKYSNIRVLVARSQQAVRDRQCDDVRECDTIKEAKTFARYSLTPEYQKSGEFSEPMNYAAVMAEEENGTEVCVADYFRKEKLVGWDVQILFGNPPRTETFSWKGSEAAVRRKAIFKPLFQKVISVQGYTQEQWQRGHGNPLLRERLCE